MTTTEIREGVLIAITERKCSTKVQPHIKRGEVYEVLEVGTTKSGAVRLVCIQEDNVIACKCCINEERFSWDITSREAVENAKKKAFEAFDKKIKALVKNAETAYRLKSQERFTREVRESTEYIRNAFTPQEHLTIAVAPLIISEIAWVYAERARKECAKELIEELKNVSRGIRKVREYYLNFLAIDLQQRELNNIVKQTKLMLQDAELSHNLTIAYYTLQNDYSRQYPNVTYKDCRVLATISILVIDAYKRHIKKVNEMLRTRGGVDISKSAENTFITDKLYALMDAIRGDFVLEKSEHVLNFEKIFDKMIASVKYTCGKNPQTAV